MKTLRPTLLAIFALLPALLVAVPHHAHAHDLPVDRIILPAGFSIEHVADVPGARSILPVPDLGAVLVSSRGDRIHAVTGLLDGGPVDIQPLKTGLKVANGIAWRDGALYVAEQHRLIRFRGTTLDQLRAAPAEVLFAGFPDRRSHGWRVAAFGPDGLLYVAVGAPCNICPTDGLEGTIVRFDVNEARPQPEIFAEGVRNSVGLGFHPDTGELWFTDNGADNMGDDVPPDEMNRAPEKGLHFGFPHFGGGDDKTGINTPLPADARLRFPEVRFGAHVAALGFDFYQGDAFPADMRGDAFVAQHGSWNRSVPDGYRIARIPMNGANSHKEWKPFAEGWLGEDGYAWGRPVDVVSMPDGTLLVSDDRAGALYRITYRAP